MDDFLRWNNNVVSNKSCAFAMVGVPYIGLLALDYEDQLDPELVHGGNKSGAPIGFTSGEYSVTSFTMSVLKDVWMVKMLPQLAALSAAAGMPGSYNGGGNVVWTAQYQEGPLVGIDTIEGCRLVSAKDGYAQGNGKKTMDLKWAALIIRRQGLTLFDPLRQP